MSEVSIRDLEVHEAIQEMVDCGISRDDARRRMRDAVKAFNCSHDWIPEGPYGQVCRKCKSLQADDLVAYFNWLVEGK
ncbi:hypothetical protein [Pseudomonas sp. zfem003]|uniref:hypothetical protein n=1 Tax=Pseudomonas sp. zfem003 TaxID=3078198 RepID=UPI002928A12F|nr:hypothetical protein [Pseudomonas sp. zfem003]MDU9398052.1 hypothetical protein [Pseudomonas sp. zfem003]